MLLLERKTKGCQDEAEDVAASYPSLLAITARHGLINPMDRLIFNGAFSRSVGFWNLGKKYIEKNLNGQKLLVNVFLETLQKLSLFRQMKAV